MPPQRLFHLVFEPHDGRALGADSEEKHEPVSDIDAVAVDGLKALDPKPPIREAVIGCDGKCVAKGHVWTYMDPARLQQGDWVRCNSHKC